MNSFFSSFFSKITEGTEHSEPTAKLVKDFLVEIEQKVDSLHHKTDNFKNSVFQSIPQPNSGNILSFLHGNAIYTFLQTKSVHINRLYFAYLNFNFENESSVVELKKALQEELLPLFFSQSTEVWQQKINGIIDTIFDYLFILTQEELDRFELIRITKNIVFKFIAELNLFQNNPAILLKIDQYIDFIFNSSQLVYTHTKSVINNVHADNKVVYAHLKPAIEEIDVEFQKVKPESFTAFSAISLTELWEIGNEFVAINKYDELQEVFAKIRNGIDKGIATIQRIFDGNEAVLGAISTLQEIVHSWLTLPDDYRPENGVEVIHFVAKNIQHTLSVYGGILGKWGEKISSFIDKLEAILSYVDNEDFKLLLTPKEQVNIHNITLPHLLEEEEEKEQLEYRETALSFSEEGETEQKEHIEKEQEEKERDEITLSISSILEYLCFDKTNGATAKLSSEYAEIIHDLYYRQWFYYRKEKVIDDAKEVFNLENLKALWQELKAMLLHENGVNVGELIDFVVEKGVEWIQKIISFLKDTVSYVIDELFALVKAILAFLKEADIPAEARNLLKKLPPFAKMPDDVTLLHVLAAIPYTLYKEFVNFNVTPETV